MATSRSQTLFNKVTRIALATIGLATAANGYRYYKYKTEWMLTPFILDISLGSQLEARRLWGLLPGLPAKAKLFEIERAILRAANDSRCVGIFVDVDDRGTLSTTDADELHAVLMAGRQIAGTKKPVIAYLSSTSDASFLAGAGASILMMRPGDTVTLAGAAHESLYFSELLTRLKIDVDISRREGYKSAAEPLFTTEMSPEARENWSAYIEEVATRFKQLVHVARRVPIDHVDALMHRGLVSDTTMQRENLVDCAIQRELVREMLVDALHDADRSTPNVLRALRDFIDGRRAVKPRLAHFGATTDAFFSTEKMGAASLTSDESSASVGPASASTEVVSESPSTSVHAPFAEHVHGGPDASIVHGALPRLPHATEPKFRAVSDYNEELAFFRDMRDLWAFVTGRLTRRGNQVAIIFANGAISETGEPSSLVSTTFLRSIAQAAHDSRVGALVVHIDSPGGDAVASESMRAALQHVSGVHRKPVVVSMGPAAASGGYLMALGANSIVAMPTTITGSIGVLGVRFGLERAARHVGVTSDAVRTHRGSVLLSRMAPLTDEHRETLDAMCGEVYADFRANVQQSRNLTLAQIEHASQGKIWSGAAAHSLGLVDHIGGLHVAVAEAARLLLQSRVLAQANQLLGPGRWIQPLKHSDVRLLMNYQAVPLGACLDAAPMLSIKAGSIVNDAEVLGALGRRMVAARDPAVTHVANMIGADHGSAGAAAVHELLNNSHGGGQGNSRIVQLRAYVPQSRAL